MEQNTRTMLTKWGKPLFFAGIALLLAGSVAQIIIIVNTGGDLRGAASPAMVWAGIGAAIGITAIVAGRIMTVIGTFRHEE